VNSRIRNFNKNYYGFYFSHTFSKEFFITGKFFLLYLLGVLGFPSFSLLSFNLGGDFALDILNSKSFYNKFYVGQKYNNVKFTRKFDDEKFVNLNHYMDNIHLLGEKIKKNIETNKD